MTNYFKRVRKKYRTLRTIFIFGILHRVDIATATTTSVAGTALATVAGYDPWTWVVGGLGAVIVHIKKEVTSRLDAIANGAISVMLAGLVSPGLTNYVITTFSISLPNSYPMAFLLSASWPWIVPTLLAVLKPGKK